MLHYQPETKTLTVAHQDYRIKEVYLDDGIYCFVPQDPDELLFITNTRRIIRAYNFGIGRGMFLRYLQTGKPHPKFFVSKPDDMISVQDAIDLYMTITSACTDGISEWFESKGFKTGTHSVRVLMDNLPGAFRSDMIFDYYSRKDDWSLYTLHKGIIQGMEPIEVATEDYV